MSNFYPIILDINLERKTLELIVNFIFTSVFQIAQNVSNQITDNKIMVRLLSGLTLSEEDVQTVGDLHYNAMTAIWLSAGVIGLWSMAFKQYKLATYLHIVCMGALICMTLIMGTLALVVFGLQSDIGDFHTILGIILMAFVIGEGLLGSIVWILQRKEKITPKWVFITNILHRIFGYCILILAMIQILVASSTDNQSIFIATIVIDLIAFVGFIIFKISKKDMQNYAYLSKFQEDQSLAIVKSQRDLAKYHGSYFIFADKVYDIDKVITSHPGGFQIINHIRGREVDRYLYGSQALQAVGHTRAHSHSVNSIALAADPIGILWSINPYQNMGEINQVIIKKVMKPCGSKYLYAIYLQSQSNPFHYKGYEELSQLGKYYTLTINDKKTRLYSVVNFIQDNNIQLINKISGRIFDNRLQDNNSQHQLTQMGSITRQNEKGGQSSGIPLIIKKYDYGSFTQQFLSGVYQKSVKISQPRGRGLGLHQMPNGNIIFLAGGTGIHPYYDIIDLIYKEFLVSKGNIHSNQIQAQNPIMSKKLLLGKYKFTLFVSVQHIGDIHDITLFQLNELAQNRKININIKVNQKHEILAKNYPSIVRIEKRFETYLPQIVKDLESVSQIYICGPPVMSTELIKTMDSLNVPNNKYTIL